MNIHIYHIRVYGNDRDFSCHYTGTEEQVGKFIFRQLNLEDGLTVEIYREA